MYMFPFDLVNARGISKQWYPRRVATSSLNKLKVLPQWREHVMWRCNYILIGDTKQHIVPAFST